MSGQFLYNVDFSVNDFDVWSYPTDLIDAEELPTCVRFMLEPSFCLQISEEEFIDQVNCNAKVIKSVMFSMSDKQVESDVDGKIVVCKLRSQDDDVMTGCYKLPNLQCYFKRLMERFKKQSESSCRNQCTDQPCSEIVNELVQLVNKNNQPNGSLHYTLVHINKKSNFH